MTAFSTRSPWACGLALFLGLAAFSACKKSTDSGSSLPANRNTGLSGNDNVGQIPQSIKLKSDLTGTTSLPASVDLQALGFMPPVGNQGQFGTCVAWATAYNAKTILEAVKFGLTQAQLSQAAYQMSPRDLFINIADDKKGAADCNGTDFVPALDVVQSRGIATLATAPYDGLTSCQQSQADPAWAADAAKHKIDNYRRLDFTAQAVKEEIAKHNPVILGAKLADNFMTWNSDAVYQNHSSFDNVGIHSYHAMCIVGYDDNKGPAGAFKVVNSWSESWGAAGFIWVDYNFMFNGFCFNNNLFTASNDNQRPNPGPAPDPVTSNGVDLVPWVYVDSSATANGPTWRYMAYDMFNIGNASAATGNGWGYAYIYYNAYNAEDYGVVFANFQDATLVNNVNPFQCVLSTTTPAYTTCKLNTTVPGNSSVASALVGSANAYLYQTYPMPTNLSGDYYLVMVADVNNKFTEQDEDNNLFYTTDQDPITFQNGVGGRRGIEGQDPQAYSNPLKARNAHLSKEAAKLRTARNSSHRNAYSPKEIVSLLHDRARTGELAQKVAIYRQNQPDIYTGGARAR